jgi:tyrosyl-tRNA synthetase
MFTTFPQNVDFTSAKNVKFGIDPTSSKLHLGHFVPLRLVRKMQEEGRNVTIVLGTFTAQLGDPSGRDSTRPILTPEEVNANADEIVSQVTKLLHPGFMFFRNSDIHNAMKLPEFLRVASKFTLARMTSRNGFQDRIEKGNSIGLHELCVPICQGLDSVHLKTEVEIGGNDQLFNFQIARELQEQHNQTPQVCVFTPIINGTDGRKMSKSLGNCIFLEEEPNEIFGKVMSISDTTMVEWLPLLTDINPGHDSIFLAEPMKSKKLLAHSIVWQLHGKEAADLAYSHFESSIQNRQPPENMPEIKEDSLLNAVALMRKCSRRQARTLIEAGAVYVNGDKVTNDIILLKDSVIKVGRNFVKAKVL